MPCRSRSPDKAAGEGVGAPAPAKEAVGAGQQDPGHLGQRLPEEKAAAQADPGKRQAEGAIAGVGEQKRKGAAEAVGVNDRRRPPEDPARHASWGSSNRTPEKKSLRAIDLKRPNRAGQNVPVVVIGAAKEAVDPAADHPPGGRGGCLFG